MTQEMQQATSHVRTFRRHEFLARADERQNCVLRIEEGWAAQYRLVPDGRRQIITLFLPGDYCEPQWLLQGRATLPIVALTRVRARALPHARIQARAPHEEDSMTRVLDAMLVLLRNREKWIFNLGRMTATERLCNLLCELYARLQARNRVVQDRCAMPLTQYDLADIVGISPVHVNRVLQTLRGDGLLDLKGRWMQVRDLAALQRLGDVATEPGPGMPRAA
ncbi:MULTISPECIES: Crp/Fnr family transcriptional regulator [unclassified Novosphingobium]|uniref:Crp/Fnr family transcriptional regulator n=1 Tax=Novosphingobium TaxID=165696 RepID=UPI001446A2CA|nr:MULTISPECIES: Crp/Fnr family transcriptional regulator [unclassified Novosphingobium]NKJ44680.1 CRP-like cAMP-binding protein [Novosphingobium sp. SG720]NMN06555.1 CRP-like cAMP-binding protein [Novosphingobium sp. SG919]NMN88995.1 CRP-like cAMP-binding protein [Novosphingobium sp. SG916]